MKSAAICAVILLVWAMPFAGFSQKRQANTAQPAAAMPMKYIPMLKDKRVALIINQTSQVGGNSLLDMMLTRGVNVKRIFVPEHGFRGNEDAGAHIANEVDSATGIAVTSLYGKNKKPKKEDLDSIDVMVYDLQDVGVRFYTYISTMEYCMEACAELGKEFIVLDRPNPNGFYVDGPVLEKETKSFVGMQRIPVVYGMTAGEYAKMLVGEQLFANATALNLKVVNCENYTHSTLYRLPTAPSPNLRTMEAIYAYPSLCLFEGTLISMGRGTDKPFRQYGCPEFAGKFEYSFTPQSSRIAKTPLHEGKVCYGELVATGEQQILTEIDNHLRLHWLIKAYKLYPDKGKFFTSYFTSLSGTPKLEAQIKKGMSENEIRKSWSKDLKAFKKIRKKYLLYPDFE